MKIRNYMAVFIAIAGLTFTSCSDDNGGSSYDPNGIEVANAELKTKLQALGYNFNEKGNLLQDEKVQKTTSLDLSNANLTSATGLDVFPNLTEVKLSNNKFEKSFDFTQLPEKVTSVDLTDNEIYEFPGLVDIKTEENGEETVTVLRKLTKLDLPESAKYNCVEIPTYFVNDKNVKLRLEDEKGHISTYTTLRSVPDDILRKYLKETFSSMFVGDNIDIAKRMVNDATENLVIQPRENNEDIEGVEYIIMNPSFKGGTVALRVKAASKLPYLKINANIHTIILSKITTGYINFIDAKNVCRCYWDSDENISKIDLSNSVLGTRGFKTEFNGIDSPSDIQIHDCPKLKDILLPSNAKYICILYLYNLPQLVQLNLSQYNDMLSLRLGGLTNIKDIQYFNPDGTTLEQMKTKMLFGISTDIYAHEATKQFLDNYHGQFIQSAFPKSTGLITYKWSEDYK